jgi:hypothetical protein
MSGGPGPFVFGMFSFYFLFLFYVCFSLVFHVHILFMFNPGPQVLTVQGLVRVLVGSVDPFTFTPIVLCVGQWISPSRPTNSKHRHWLLILPRKCSLGRWFRRGFGLSTVSQDLCGGSNCGEEPGAILKALRLRLCFCHFFSFFNP